MYYDYKDIFADSKFFWTLGIMEILAELPTANGRPRCVWRVRLRTQPSRNSAEVLFFFVPASIRSRLL